jgi:hypothetical protein
MSAIQPRTATIDIYQGDYLDRIRHLERQYEAAVRAEEDSPPLRNGEVPESQALFDEHKALVAEAEESKIVVKVGALGRKGWRALIAEHPPRKDNEGDAGMGVNEDTFKDALVPLSVLSPDLTEDDYDQISDGDFERIFYVAFALNRSPAASPKVLASPASLANRTSGEN